MKYILKLIFCSLCFISQAYSLEFTLQDLGLEWYASSTGSGLNNSGMIVGKLREEDRSYTDFVWTKEKGLILLNPKQATAYQEPLINDLGQVFGLSWHKVEGWFSSHQEKNLYRYDLDKGFVNITPPKEWKRETLRLSYSPYVWELKTPKLFGCTNLEEILVEESDKFGIWKSQNYQPIEIPEGFTPYQKNHHGYLFLGNKTSKTRGYSAFAPISNLSQIQVLDYFNDHPDDASEETFTAILKVLSNGEVFGIIGGHKSYRKLVSYRWNENTGFELLPNFRLIDANDKGMMIGHGYFEKECCPEPAIWHEGKMQRLKDLLKTELKSEKIVNLVQINDAGQILIHAKGSFGTHAFLLNPN